MRRAGGPERTNTLVRKHRPDYLILMYMGILMLIGLVVMYAIGPQRANVLNNAIGSNFSESYFFIKQTVSLFLALGAFAAMALIPHNWIIKQGPKLLVIGFIACVFLAFAGWAGASFAEEINGATRWFNLGVFGSLQPAEILKFGLLLYLAVFLATRVGQGLINDLNKTLIPVALMSAAALFIVIVVQKDLGTGISVTAIIMTMLFVAGIHRKIIFSVLGALAIAGVLLIVTSPHRIDRVATYLKGDDTSTSDAGSYHIQHAKIAIGTGGLFGVGIGNSVQATGYLPEAINDSVFAILGETFGFLGLMALLAIFVALLMRLLRVMDHLVDIRLKLLVAGVFGWFGVHVILNIAAMLGIFPLTGITLPLLSFGGTSMIFITAALGLVFQLSRYTVHGSRLKETENEDSRSRRGVGRPRYAGRRSS